MTDPLPRGQQILLQRLMAKHVMTDQEAQEVFDQYEFDEIGSNSLFDCFSSINAQLTRGFGLEIVSMMGNGKRYHAVINQHTDNVAKESFSSIVGPSERAFCRSMMEACCEEPCAFTQLINKRLDLKEPLSLDELKAERVIENVIEEGYLQYATDNKNSKISLGPRAFLELSSMLIDLGYDKENLPQFIFHRN